MRKPTALNDLPLELLLMISAHLSPVDLVCLALGNRYLLNSIAGTAFKNFSKCRTDTPTDSARIELLSRLSYDLPQYHLCFICLRLHLWKSAGLPGCYSAIDTYPEHVVDIATDYTTWYLKRPLPLAGYPSYAFEPFYFVHLQLAMRRFYYGPEFGIPVESFLYTEIDSCRLKPKGPPFSQPQVNKTRVSDTQNDIMMVILSADARICSMPPGLCMRTQSIAVVARQNVPRMWPGREKGPMQVCMHIKTFDESGIGGILGSQIERYCSSSSPQVPADHGSCDKCSTAWQLQIRTLNDTHASLTLTVWMDLGPGLSPEDPRWKYRLDHSYHVRASFPAEAEILEPRSRFERDSVEAMSPDALSEDEMYCRNISLLKGKTYQAVMSRAWGGRYIMHGEARTRKSNSRCIIL